MTIQRLCTFLLTCFHVFTYPPPSTIQNIVSHFSKFRSSRKNFVILKHILDGRSILFFYRLTCSLYYNTLCTITTSQIYFQLIRSREKRGQNGRPDCGMVKTSRLCQSEREIDGERADLGTKKNSQEKEKEGRVQVEHKQNTNFSG